MPVKKFVVGCFQDEDVLFSSVKDVRNAGYKIHDVYTPYPVHGLDSALGLRQTSLHVAGFFYGITGTTLALSFMSWVFIKDWPINIGGKPAFSLPAFIPVTFEVTVLFSAVGMVLTFLYLCQMAPFVKKHHFHERATDDLFVMVVECTNKTNEEELSSFVSNTGAEQVNVQIAETGWWIGRYDKETNILGKREVPETL